MFTLFYFFLALFILVIVHEYGHFIVARCCGVKVLRFSFGFGKALLRWRDRYGTEFVWALLPLGGYVKMLDENEEKVPEQERHLAFNNKPVLVRIAVVAAGPLFNFIFAFIVFWLVLVIGIKTLAPVIDKVKPNSIAAMAGLEGKQEILSLNNKPVASWRDFQFALMPFLGENKASITMQVKSLLDGSIKQVKLTLTHWKLEAKNEDPLAGLGIVPFIPRIPPVIEEIIHSSPGEKMGLQPGDVIKQINNSPIDDWLTLLDFVRQHPHTNATFTLLRQGKLIDVQGQIGAKDKNGEGFLGVRSQKITWSPQWLRYQRENPWEAIGTAFRQTLELSKATFSLIGRLVTGKLDLKNLSGPIGIAQGASESARSGLAYYLSFLGLISISLGVLNLLPIPLLDGGHLFYCMVEMIKKRPVSEETKAVGVYLGLFFLIALMILALSNDIARLLE